MTTISFSGSLYFNNDNELSYSTDNSNWTAVTSFPVTLNNTGGSTGSVYFNTDITFYDSSSKYFIIGSSNITVDGQNHLVTISSITLYPGIFNNGSDGVNGYSNITIKDMSCASTSSSIGFNGGWFAQRYFSRGASNNLLNNLSTSASIGSWEAGGICGSNAADTSGSLTITSCYSTGSITSSTAYAGGICGSYAANSYGHLDISGCYSTGSVIAQECGGICGNNAGINHGTVTISNCYSTGNMTKYGAGGICGSKCGGNVGSITITNCYSTGNITLEGESSGGICGWRASQNLSVVTITNCYSTGEIGCLYSGGIIGGEACYSRGSYTISNCYSTGVISGSSAGGIVGGLQYDTDKTVIVQNCYSRGNITGAAGGGIYGFNLSSNSTGYTTAITIQNCYSCGTLFDASCGAICAANNNTSYANVNITNCYGVNGPLYSTSQGTNVSFTTTSSGVGSGSWYDLTAVSYLTGGPTYSGTTLTAQGSIWNDPSITSTSDPFVLDAIPVIGSISPSKGTTGTVVTINGFNLNNSTVVTFSGTGSTISENTDIKIKCAAPSIGSTGSVPVIVTTTYGTATTYFTYNVTCFNEGTKILCLNKQGEEEYIKIENLRKGDLVKTCLNGYKAIDCIGKSVITNPNSTERIKDRLYILKNDKYPELFEDLIITGCHSVLVDNITDEQRKQTEEILKYICVTDRKYRLIACLDERAEPYSEGGNYTIYHLALENDDYYMNYGIYANGLLVETTSKRWIKELSGMTLIE